MLAWMLDSVWRKVASSLVAQDQFDRMDMNHDGVLQRSEWDRGMQAIWEKKFSIHSILNPK